MATFASKLEQFKAEKYVPNKQERKPAPVPPDNRVPKFAKYYHLPCAPRISAKEAALPKKRSFDVERMLFNDHVRALAPDERAAAREARMQTILSKREKDERRKLRRKRNRERRGYRARLEKEAGPNEVDNSTPDSSNVQ